MNKLNFYSGANPITKDDFEFQAEAYRDVLAGLISGLTDVSAVKITGCVITILGTIYSCTAGYIYQNGEVFKVDAHSFDAGSLAMVYFTPNLSYAGSGRKLYPDNTYKECHEIRKALLAGGSTLPSGMLAYNGKYILAPESNWHELTEDELLDEYHKCTLFGAEAVRSMSYKINVDKSITINGMVTTDYANAGTRRLFQLPEALRPNVYHHSLAFYITSPNNLPYNMVIRPDGYVDITLPSSGVTRYIRVDETFTID